MKVVRWGNEMAGGVRRQKEVVRGIGKRVGGRCAEAKKKW